jgi:nucleoid DNA-binding protein
MNKNELAAQMAKDGITPKTTALKVLDAMIEVVSRELKKADGKITLVGFGTFKTIVKKAKTGRNPKTGATIHIPKKKVPKFIAGKALKDLVK